ncbi:MAG: YegP family protein [Nitrospirota bacterium]|nr:YegP family protein [Nitrospirota bacterium]MDH5775646.1 YegP family protein [Nitrospirota bacterium]
MGNATSRFEVFEGKNGKFYFRLKVQSGEIILSSQGYALRSSARRAIQSVRDHASDAACYVTKKNKAGKSYFVLVARNSKVIGTSQSYASPQGVKKGIEAVKKAAVKAGIE